MSLAGAVHRYVHTMKETTRHNSPFCQITHLKIAQMPGIDTEETPAGACLYFCTGYSTRTLSTYQIGSTTGFLPIPVE